MGKPFVVCQESGPKSPLFRDMSASPDVFNRSGKLDSAATMLLMTETAPPQDALQAAESYFQQIRESSSRKSNGRHVPPRTFFEMLVDEAQTPTKFAPTQQRQPVGEALQTNYSKLPGEVESTVSPGQGDIDLEESPSEFSLENSHTSPHESMFSPPAQLERMILPARRDIGLDTPSELSLDDSDTGTHESMCSPPMVSSSDSVLQENEETVQGWNFVNVEGVNSESLDGCRLQSRVDCGPQGAQNSLEPLELEDGLIEEIEHPYHGQDSVSKSEFEWTAVLRRSAKSLDSISHESFKTSRSTGISSTSSRGSLSDEAISERASAWGNGVARLVLKNSSRESTPRTSNGSSVDGLQYGLKIPGVAKHVKDALSSFQLAFVVCDVINAENPILYASAGFFNMTGYSPKEVVGRNCRFLQGVDTDAKEVARIRNALTKGEAYSGTILNYKKNGAPFWNLLTLSPISDDKGVVIKYMGMQAEVNSHSTTTTHRKKTALDSHFKDVPRSVSQSITEEIAQPANAPSKRSERGDDVPIFTLPGASRLTATRDPNGRSQGSKRYSLTYGTRTHPGRSRSAEIWSGRPIGGSETHSAPSERKHSLPPQQRPAKTNSAARPFYWLLTAARILEEEIHQLGCDPNFARQRSETITRHEDRKGGVKKKNKISRVAKGVFGLFRKIERKVFKRTSRGPIPSNRVNAYDSESDLEIDDFPELGIMNDYCFERQDLRCESMPHINSTRGGSAANSLMKADLRARSSRYFPSATSDTPNRKTFSPHTNEFALDRKQFCIVHD